MKGSAVAAGLVFASITAVGVGLSAQAARPHSMTGCLQRNAETTQTDVNGNVSRTVTYKLTDVEGTGPKVVEITESPMSMAIHLYHKVEITGTAVPGKDKAMHYMKVTSLKDLANQCP